MNNMSSADNVVSEYLIYRGFTETFKSFEKEKKGDRMKQFESSKIVNSLFNLLHSFDVRMFISHWDFLNKRFFVHLDSEHALQTQELKADLLKYFLVYAFKSNAKEKISEFFKHYSHEILVADGISRHLRPWFVLPFVERPEDDSEFAVYFTAQWTQDLKLTLTNFLSTVLRTAPLPKLLLLEKWFRSESQQETRSQLKLSFQKMDILVNRLEKNEERLARLREVVKDLVSLLQKTDKLDKLSVSGGLFDSEHESVRLNKLHLKEMGVSVVKMATECASKSKQLQALPQEHRLKEILGKEMSSLLAYRPPTAFDIDVSVEQGSTAAQLSGLAYVTVEDSEASLIEAIQTWLEGYS